MFVTLALLILYLLVGVAAVGVARWLKQPAPLRYGLTLWILPIIFTLPGFFAGRTILPAGHAMAIPPWNTVRPVAPYNPNLNDAATQMAPWAKAVRMSWKEGALPLRQRWNGGGMALAANSQSAAFSPLTFLMLPLPLAHAFTLAAAVKLFLALLGTWLWLSRLGVSRVAALFGAVSFGFSCTMTPWILFPHTSVICLWPWALFAIELLGDEEIGRRAFWVLTAVFFCWAVSGHPESAALGGLFAGLWLLARLLSRDLPRPGLVLSRIALSAATALGLSAFVLVPQALAIRASSRVAFMEDFVRRLPFRLTPHAPFWGNGLVTAFFPRALGDQIASPMVGGGAGSFPEMALGYFGIVGWAAALAILRPGSPRKRSEIALLAPFLIGLAAAIGQWPVAEIALLVPVLRMMLSLRYFTWVALAGSAIAAFELDRFREDLAERRRGTAAILAIPIALAAYAYFEFRRLRPLHEASGGLPSQQKALAVVVISLGLAAAILLVSIWKRRPAVVTACLLLLSAGAAAELLYQGMRLYRFGSPADLYPDTPLIAFLRSRPGPFRVVGEGKVLFPNSNVFAGVEDVRTHDPIERRDYVDFLDATCGYPSGEYFKTIGDVNASALDFLNVRYLVSGPGRSPPGEKWRLLYNARDGTVFENRYVLPRVFAPAMITRVSSGKTGGWVRNAFEAFRAPASALGRKRDWREHAFVLSPETGTIANGRASVTDYRESVNSAYFRVRVDGEEMQTLLVVSLTQDGGWSARDEAGRAIETTLANGPFLALRVPRGDHEVALKYSPPGFFLGVLISVTCLASVAIATLRSRAAQSVSLAAKLPNPTAWLAAATAVLIAGLALTRWTSPKAALHVPATPIDFTSSKMAPLWNFLTKVRDTVPPGSSYTILAADPDEEMALFMFSLGVLDRRRALPTSYFGMPRPEGRGAQYIIVYGRGRTEIGSARLIRDLGEGAVYSRSVGR